MSKPGKYLTVLTVAVCLMFAAGPTPATEGAALKPVACDPADGAAYPTASVGVTLTKTVGAGAGTKNPKAMYGTGRAAAMPFSVAADAVKAGTLKPDAVRIAFNASGKFDPKQAIPFTNPRFPRPDYYQAEFGPAVVPLERDGKTYPVGIRGRYYSYRDRRRAYFTFAVAVQGACRFADKTRAVRFLDTTGNFRFDDAPQVAKRSYGARAGDIVLIDTGDGTFGGSVVRAYYGQPVCVDGAWYDVAVSEDGAKATVTPAKVAAGKLSIAAEAWEVALVGGGKAMIATGGKDPVAVPAGKYQVMYYREWSAADKDGLRSCFMAGLREYSSGRGKTLTVSEGATAKLAITSPLKAQLSARASGRSIQLRMSTPATQGGLSLMTLMPPGGWIYTRPPCPELQIRDAAGQLVGKVTLEYG